MAPPNNNFSHAARIPSKRKVTVTGSNVGATPEDGEETGVTHIARTPQSSVWWKWTAPADAAPITAITTFGSRDRLNPLLYELDTVVGVFTGSGIGSLTQVAVNDDWADGSDGSPFTNGGGGDSEAITGSTVPEPLASAVVFEPVPGTTYYIMVAGFQPYVQGPIVLSVTPCQWSEYFSTPVRKLASSQGSGFSSLITWGGRSEHSYDLGFDGIARLHEAYAAVAPGDPHGSVGQQYDAGNTNVFGNTLDDPHGWSTNGGFQQSIAYTPVHLDPGSTKMFNTGNEPPAYLDYQVQGYDDSYIGTIKAGFAYAMQRFYYSGGESSANGTASNIFGSGPLPSPEGDHFPRAFGRSADFELRVFPSDYRFGDGDTGLSPMSPPGTVVWSTPIGEYPSETPADPGPVYPYIIDGYRYVQIEVQDYLLIQCISTTAEASPLDDMTAATGNPADLPTHGYNASQVGGAVIAGCDVYVQDLPIRYLLMETPIPANFFPPLRQRQRDDALASPYAPRVEAGSANIPTSKQKSIRKGTPNTYI